MPSATLQLPELSRGYRSFIRSNEKRVGSEEKDYGIWWKRKGDVRRFRVAWIPVTGELYAVALGPQNNDEYIILLRTDELDVATADALMKGWDNPHDKLYQNLDELMWRAVLLNIPVEGGTPCTLP